MKRALVVALLLTACGGRHDGAPVYNSNDLMLLANYNAKDACSCLFVMEQTEEYCHAWTKANPPLGHWTYDKTTKTVTSSAMLLWSATAKYVDDTVGCQLQQ